MSLRLMVSALPISIRKPYFLLNLQRLKHLSLLEMAGSRDGARKIQCAPHHFGSARNAVAST